MSHSYEIGDILRVTAINDPEDTAIVLVIENYKFSDEYLVHDLTNDNITPAMLIPHSRAWKIEKLA